MKRREYLTGVAGVGALTTVGAVGSVGATTSNHVIGTIPDPTGDDDGPGGYTYPTSSEFKDGVYDMTGVTIADEGDAWSFEVGIDGPVEDAYDFGSGFGVQIMQLYVQDPNAGDDVPTSTSGRPGSGVNFAEPYHYRVHVAGDGQVVEDASSEAGAYSESLGSPEVIATSEESDVLTASGSAEDSSITFMVPKDAIGGGNIEDKNIALLMFGQDGFGVGGIRTNLQLESAQYAIGIGDNGVINAPRALDMLDPEGVVNQYDALGSYTEDSLAELPLFQVGEAISGGGSGGGGGGGFSLPASAMDPTGDDDGPGGYTYPTSSEFKDGVYDMTEVTVSDDGDALSFEVGIAGPVEDAYDFGSGFGVQVLELYLQDPNAGSDVPTSTAGRPGTGINFTEPYHYRVHVMGDGQVVEDASSEAGAYSESLGSPEVLATSEESDVLSASGSAEDSTITFTVPKSAIGGGDNLGDYKAALFMFGQDGFGVGGIRTNLQLESAQYAIGLGDNGVINAPRALDMLDPEGVVDQYEVLGSYTEDSLAEAPLVAMSDLFTPADTGEQEAPDSDGDGVPDDEDYAPNDPNVQDPPAGPSEPMSETVPGGEGPPTSTDRDNFVEDVDGDGDADIDDLQLLAEERKSDIVQSNSAYFDYNDDGDFTLSDLVTLFRKIT
jgi:carbohydrate-binding DOMON domain-containing protein